MLLHVARVLFCIALRCLYIALRCSTLLGILCPVLHLLIRCVNFIFLPRSNEGILTLCICGLYLPRARYIATVSVWLGAFYR